LAARRPDWSRSLAGHWPRFWEETGKAAQDVGQARRSIHQEIKVAISSQVLTQLAGKDTSLTDAAEKRLRAPVPFVEPAFFIIFIRLAPAVAWLPRFLLRAACRNRRHTTSPAHVALKVAQPLEHLHLQVGLDLALHE